MKEDLIKHLPPVHPGPDHVHWFDTIDSTNTYAKALAQSGAPQGTVVIADRQTGGRGRMGRSFSSPGGMGIYLSMILRPECEATELMHLTCAVAVAMCDAVEGVSGFRPQVKWINDLMAKGKKTGRYFNGTVSRARYCLRRFCCCRHRYQLLPSRHGFS